MSDYTPQALTVVFLLAIACGLAPLLFAEKRKSEAIQLFLVGAAVGIGCYILFEITYAFLYLWIIHT